jgi:hypothetical protein
MARAALFLAAGVAALALRGPAAAQTGDVAPALTRPAEAAAVAANWRAYPLFAAEVERARQAVLLSMRNGVVVPVPKDSGGGYTHEQHKRNYRTIYAAGQLYRITGERQYVDHARDILLAYAKLYPTLGRHPAGREELPGRLFWQTLNDSVWLVNSIQGYDAIRGALTPDERRTIEDNVFRRAARFLSDETPQNFNLIHNHATWALAGVGMTGYVLRDREMVDKALLGLDRSGKAGFLRQLDLLFSRDGYYEEGPYYQRYALMPFVVFAKAIDVNEPQRQIFRHRDGILPKAIRTTIQLTYGGYFFPLNDAIKDKGLDTEELHHAVAIAYGLSQDPAFLSVAQAQGRTVLTPDGMAVAKGLAEGRAKPFPFASALLRDGPTGEHGGLAILRSGSGPKDQALVMKNTAQGMGHGHFDKLSWVFYDNGQEVVTDYGSARFLNVETKGGGGYLPENTTWAKQTLAHNTLVVNEQSHFGFDRKIADKAWPELRTFHGDGATKLASARMASAYPGVDFTRTLALVEHPDLEHPLVVDLLKVSGKTPAQYDLPLHFAGHITNLGFNPQSHTEARPVLGTKAGYQHVWVDATATPMPDQAYLTWLLKNRFYTYRFLPSPGSSVILAETGANDPSFNLRREPVVIQRLSGATDAAFVSVLEPHGEYNGAAEYTLAPRSRIARLDRTALDGADVITIELQTGRKIVLALAADADPGRRHRIQAAGKTLQWTGPFARFDQ